MAEKHHYGFVDMAPQQPVQPSRILVVEDDRDAADMFVMMLQTFGYEARAAYSSQSALEMAGHSPPDVVLLDIGLPGMDGYEVARRLRQHPHTKEVKIIAVTGYEQATARQRTQEAGFDYHLVKPVDARKLRDLMATLAKQPRSAT